MNALKEIIAQAWENRELLKEEITQNAIREVVDLLDNGILRVAEPTENGWQVNEWIKKAVVLYFSIQKMETVGSCAQIGKNVHLSGGVGIGGVLEPLQAAPVIIEDNVFVGSRCIVVEGIRVEREAVLDANVVL